MVKSFAVIGRTHSCDLRIPVPEVSRKHCELVIEDGKLVLRDLESSNGTFCNGNRVKEIELEPGDTITVGPVKFVVQIEGEPDEVTPLPTVLESAMVNLDGGNDLGTQAPVVSKGDALAPFADDDDGPPVDLVDALDESIDLMPEDADPVAALETMAEEADPGDSGPLPDEDRPRDDG